MQHFSGGVHTTTALSRQHPDGDTNCVRQRRQAAASLAFTLRLTRRSQTRLASRFIGLTRNQQYLILGSSLGEVIQGSVYNNLIRPGGGSDVIIAGPNNNEIQDIISNLDGITVKNFHAGNILNFTRSDIRMEQPRNMMLLPGC